VVSVLRNRWPPGFYLKSVRSGENDVLAEGLTVPPSGTVQVEILVASDTGRVACTVAHKDGRPASGATVVLLPEARLRGRRERSKTGTTDQYGKLELKSVPPNAYRLFA
jgi:hypothetical protein